MATHLFRLGVDRDEEISQITLDSLEVCLCRDCTGGDENAYWELNLADQVFLITLKEPLQSDKAMLTVNCYELDLIWIVPKARSVVVNIVGTIIVHECTTCRLGRDVQ